MGMTEASHAYDNVSALAAADDVPPGYKRTEVGVIPADWDVTSVDAEFSVQLGKMLDSEKNTGVARPFLGNRAVQWGRINLAGVGEIKLTPTDLQRYRLRAGDLLVCEGGEVGRSAIWKGELEECYYQKALHRLRPKRNYDVRLMQNMLQNMASSGYLQNFVTQTSIAHLPKDKFVAVQLPLPASATEQAAIAEALSDADALIESLEQLLSKKRQIKQGAMQELLTGKLRLTGFSGEWETRTLGELGTCYRGVSYNPDKDLRSGDTDETLRLLRSNNVQDSNIAIEGLQFVSPGRVSRVQVLRPNDVLICMANGSKELVGKAARFNVEDGMRYTFGAFMGCFRPDTVAGDPGYTFYLFQTEAYRRHISILLAGSSINNLTPGNVEGLMVDVPADPVEQAAVVNFLSDMDAELSALETKLTKARQLKQGMMQELLTGRIRLV